MSGFAPSLQAIPMAFATAFLDVITVFEFTVVNYATRMIKNAAQPALPAGIVSILVLDSIDAAGEVAKQILYKTNEPSKPGGVGN